jgi:hypothetical protein
MALGARKVGPNGEVVIPKPLDDPAYRAATDLLAQFSNRIDLLQRARLRVTYEVHFSTRSPENDSETDKTLRQRLADLAADPPLQPVPAAAPSAPSPAIAKGLAVLAGETVAPPPSFTARIADIDRQIEALRPAYAEQRERCAALLDELSFEYWQELKRHWDTFVVRDFFDAQQLSRSFARHRDFHRSILAAGIRFRSDVLKEPNIQMPLLLGDEADYNSGISYWRRLLEDWKVL